MTLRHLAFLLPLTLFAQKIEVQLVQPPKIKDRLEQGAVPQKERQPTIRKIFEEAGCTVEEQRVDRGASNVICTLPGEAASTIVVGGHYDFVDHGAGIVDDWSGTSMLPSLFEALKGRPRQHTFVFVAFAREELGLIGSKQYVKDLTKEQKSRIVAFVNLECLGLSPTKVWVRRSTPELVSRLLAVAKAIEAPVEGANVDAVGDDDTHPFLSSKIPVISIHSVTPATLPILHTPRDKMSAIHLDDYYASYKLIADYLAYLDLKVE